MLCKVKMSLFASFDNFLASVQSTINAFYNISFLLPVMTTFLNKILMFSSIKKKKKIIMIFNICGSIDGSEINVHSYYLYQTSNNNNNNE